MNKLPAETSLLCVKGEAKETDNIRPANIKIYISWAILYRKLLNMVKKVKSQEWTRIYWKFQQTNFYI